MIGLDTNVLIRYLMKDDIKQFNLAEKVVESAIKRKNLMHISLVVLCEVVWVLNYTYELKREEIAKFLDKLLHAEYIEIENRQLALTAFHEYRHTKADFADCVIGLINLSFSCTTTYTFDKKAAKLAFFTAL
ncbi:MAG: type II toxin-antitoxin system VapC family toxin [Verrucomicrobia bacterium]|nr:type II toxin-antitoxin system VapC family toxin [Verrucomicrobiota bacterium]